MSEVYIDDVDASIAYSGSWLLTVTEQRSYHNTLHYTNTIGSKATLTFTGITVMAYGTVRGSDTPQSSYSIDGGSVTIFRPSAQVLSTYGQLFYTSPSLQNGQHTLVITNLNDTSTLFIDDFIIVTTGDASASTHASASAAISTVTTAGTPASSSGGAHSGSSSASSGSSTTATTLAQFGVSASSGDVSATPGGISSSSPSTPAAPDSAMMHGGPPRPKAAILGAVIAVAIIAIFIVASLWRIRNRKRKKDLDAWAFSNSTDGPAAHVTHVPIFFHADTPQTTEQSSPPPPPPLEYPMVEPPPYEAAGYVAGPQVEVAGQPPRKALG